MRKLIGFFFLLCLFSCNEPLVDSLPRFMREPGRSGREGSNPEPGDTSALIPPVTDYVPSVYATALHFRDSVNWRLDSLGAAEVLFFKDGKLMQRQSVASPPDPERHRIWNSQLWTDSTDGHETVLCCDGQERFRYPGEEQLRGFLIVDGDVHTLGQRPGNGGFCYRINGEAVYSRDKGSVLGTPSVSGWKGGALYQDGEDICYSYRVDQEYHVMKGAETFRILPIGSSSDILYDIRVRDGHLWRVQKHAETLVFMRDDEVVPLSISASSVISCRLVPSGDDVQVLGCKPMGGGWYSFWLAPFETGDTQMKGQGRSPLSELCYWDPDILFADINSAGLLYKLSYDNTDQGISMGVYTLLSPLNLFVTPKHYAAALTHSGTGPHLLFHDGEETLLSFNGYFTSVIIE